MTATNTTLHEAIRLALAGLRVVPIAPGKKRPAMTGWQKAATTDRATIREWWTGNYSGHGIGVATGHLEDGTGFFVLDIDEHNPECSGTATLAALEAQHGPLPRTRTSLTGGGGRHLFFRVPAGREVPRNDQSGRLGPGIDVRGEGGQVVVAPTVHPNGKAYRWNGYHPEDAPMEFAPDWLLDALTPHGAGDGDNPESWVSDTRESTSRQAGTVWAVLSDDGPAGRYNDSTTWHELLTGDGWALGHTDHEGRQHWVRPGKDPRGGTSATVGHAGADVLVVFTSSIPWLPPGNYSRFGYYACRHHHGDRSAAARHLRNTDQAPQHVATVSHETVEPTDGGEYDPLPIPPWPELFAGPPAVDALVEGVVIPGRWVSIVAAAKQGKSSLLLHIATALARGRDPFYGTERPPVRVLYLDCEMGRLDVIERLVALGIGPDDLGHLDYTDLVPKCDNVQGGAAVVSKVNAVGHELVIVDGINGLIDAAEKEDLPWRRVFDNLVAPLKRAGVAVLTADNTGKDTTLGARGSSVKADKPDGVLELKRTDNGVQLKATHRRTAAITDHLQLVMVGRDGDRALDYKVAAFDWPAGTAGAAQLLDTLGVPTDWGRDRARKALKDGGHTMRDTVLAAAIRYRKLHPETGGNRSGNRSREQVER